MIILLAACACGGAAHDVTRAGITIRVPAGHDRDTGRYEKGAATTLEVLGAWLVPYPDGTIAIAPAETRWWTTPASMLPETAAARATARRYFERQIDTSALPAAFVDALVEYAARRAVSKIFDREYFSVNRGRLEGRYFGGFVPRDLHAPLPVEGDGDRALLTLDTLDRFVGRPVFDAVMTEFVTAGRAKPTIDDFVALASRVSGQDVAWLFAEAMSRGRFDYAIARFDSRPEGNGTFRTTVTVRRLGDAVFRRTLPVVTTFADGDSVRETFDGRSTEATYDYRSHAEARTASVDPDGMLMLDVNRGNNGMSLDTSAARTAANRWTARWFVWLEDALLTYVALT